MSDIKNEVIINGIIYAPKTVENSTDYVIVRTYSAGVFAGYIEKASEDGKKVTMRGVRCLWSWEGAASLMQLASTGTCRPDECRFTVTIDRLELTEVIEVLYCTEKAKKQIEGMKAWLVK